MRHVMFDIETLGSHTLAPIVQMAAIEFGADGKSIGDTLNLHVELTSIPKEFSPDYSTIIWWLQQSKEAQDAVFSDDCVRPTLKLCLEQMNAFFGKDNKTKVWSHATFDAVIFMEALKVFKIKPLISYRNFMDIRTLKYLAGGVEEKAFKGVQHDALSDCEHQAEYVSRMLLKLI